MSVDLIAEIIAKHIQEQGGRKVTRESDGSFYVTDDNWFIEPGVIATEIAHATLIKQSDCSFVVVPDPAYSGAAVSVPAVAWCTVHRSYICNLTTRKT